MRRALSVASGPFPFAEQDFLNAYFRGRAKRIPPSFNALKHAFRNPIHMDHLVLPDCVVLHFVMVKPWERRATFEEEFADLFELWHKALAKYQPTSILRPYWEKHLLRTDLPGLWYVPEFVGPGLENVLVELLYGPELRTRWQQLSRRQVLCLGGVPHADGAICEFLPDTIQRIAQGLRDVGALSAVANQCFVNSYPCGQGIDAHMDGPRFHPEVAVISLEGPASIRFRLFDRKAHPELPPMVSVHLQPRSLLVFSGDPYEHYVHVIDDHEADAVAEGSVLVPRAPRRTSLTLRMFASVQLRAEEVACERRLSARKAQFAWWSSELGEID